MSKLLLFCTLFLTASLMRAQDEAPSPRQIADTYIENTGGMDAWKKLDALRMEGKATMQGQAFPMTVVAARGNKMRLDLDIMGSPMTQAYDGETAWILFPMQGITEPKEMTAEEAKQFTEEPFVPVWFDSEERGYTLEGVEGREVEGTPTYGVRVTNEEGYDRTYFFETENMVPILMIAPMPAGPMAGSEMETYLSDYQEVDASGLIMPMYVEQKMGGQAFMQMSYDEIAVNPEVEEGMFSMPE